jgi:hypothetical protein
MIRNIAGLKRILFAKRTLHAKIRRNNGLSLTIEQDL